jgi:glyoxylase-like metal-dependent hydrolase (beta-lactamase superfamily II)
MPTVRHIRMAFNNVYVVEDAGDRLLVDTGPDYRGARQVLEQAMPDWPPGMVVATHGHLDHAGLAAWWKSRGVPVALGEADAHFTLRPQLNGDPELTVLASLVEDSGAPAEVRSELLAGLRTRRQRAAPAASERDYPPPTRNGRWPTGLRYESFNPSVTIETGRELPANCRAIPSPGHTPGNLVVIHPGEGWLFSGDQLLPEITPTPAIQRAAGPAGELTRFRSLPRFVESLRRLQALRFTRCWPGHGEPFDNVGETIAANLQQVEERSERVLEAVRSMGAARLFGVSEALYPRALRRRFWQIASTVQGHLDLLEEEGRVQATDGSYQAT